MGCTVESITLSEEQKKMAEKRIKEEGLSEWVTIHLCDYRQLPEAFEHSFDAFVASEMFEVSFLS